MLVQQAQVHYIWLSRWLKEVSTQSTLCLYSVKLVCIVFVLSYCIG